MRGFSIIMGIVIALAGAFCIANSGMLFMSIAFLVGIAMLLAGFAGACAYMFGSGETKYEASWFLSESLLVMIIGLFALFNTITSDAAVPYVFGMLVLTSGLLRLVISLTKKSEMERHEFVAILIMGILGTMIGVYFFANSELLNLSAVTLVSIALFLQGINMLIYGVLMPSNLPDFKFKSNLRKVKIDLSKHELRKIVQESDAINTRAENSAKKKAFAMSKKQSKKADKTARKLAEKNEKAAAKAAEKTEKAERKAAEKRAHHEEIRRIKIEEAAKKRVEAAEREEAAKAASVVKAKENDAKNNEEHIVYVLPDLDEYLKK